MEKSLIYGTVFASFFLALNASAGSVPLDTTSYNFQLAGGGGGAQATLNGVPVEIFCDDFSNDIWVPSVNSANVTTLGTGANLDETRFGSVSSTQWTTIDLSGDPATATTDEAFLNSGSGAAAAARYDMVAYLVSQYNTGQGGTTSNNQIQEAIWTLMDPTAEGAAIDPSGVDPTAELEAAANWYNTMDSPGNQQALNSFLAQFEVVSDAAMTVPSVGVGVGGFQEQIVMTPTPEPRGSAWMLIGLFGLGGFLLKRARGGFAAFTARAN
jgi:hypothetical protein